MAHEECQEAGIAAADGTLSAFVLGLPERQSWSRPERAHVCVQARSVFFTPTFISLRCSSGDPPFLRNTQVLRGRPDRAEFFHFTTGKGTHPRTREAPLLSHGQVGHCLPLTCTGKCPTHRPLKTFATLPIFQ